MFRLTKPLWALRKCEHNRRVFWLHWDKQCCVVNAEMHGATAPRGNLWLGSKIFFLCHAAGGSSPPCEANPAWVGGWAAYPCQRWCSAAQLQQNPLHQNSSPERNPHRSRRAARSVVWWWGGGETACCFTGDRERKRLISRTLGMEQKCLPRTAGAENQGSALSRDRPAGCKRWLLRKARGLPLTPCQHQPGLLPSFMQGGTESSLPAVGRRLSLVVLCFVFSALLLYGPRVFPSLESSSSSEDTTGMPTCEDTHEQNCLWNLNWV